VKPLSELYRDPKLVGKQILRRYMDLAKFIDLLRSRSLYLCRADKFPDRFEGALIPAIRRAIDDNHRKGTIDYNADAFYEKCRKSVYVNCWSIGADDNMALWHLYGGVASAIAITTTVTRLTHACLGWNESVMMEGVRYIDHAKNPDMIIGRYTDPLCFKHKAYTFENEVRILLCRLCPAVRKNPKGIRMPLTDLGKVIRSVIVAPEADVWFFKLVQDIVRRYDFSIPVRRSKLTRLPR
jgi:hypothetical protein